MRFKKAGFSIAELLVVLLLIAVIIIFELMSLKGRINQYGTPYYTVYRALEKASYNVLADMYCPDHYTPDFEDPTCADGPRPFPETSEGLCKRLKEFINTANEQGSCSNPSIDTEASNIKDETLKFVASNATKYYISDMQTITIDDNEIKYFIVYVDLNGKERPNKVDKTPQETLFPDIVPFAVTTRGEVIPMGYPIYSPLYLTAQVRYIAEQSEDPDKEKEMETEKSRTYNFYQARTAAWNNVEAFDIPFSIDFNSRLSDTNLAKAFYKDMDYTANASFESGKGCEAKKYNCRVKIEKNKNARF